MAASERNYCVHFDLLRKQRFFIVSHNSRANLWSTLKMTYLPIRAHCNLNSGVCVCACLCSLDKKFTVYKALYMAVQKEWHRQHSDKMVNWFVCICEKVSQNLYCICVSGGKQSFMVTWVTTGLYRAHFTRNSKTHDCFTQSAALLTD